MAKIVSQLIVPEYQTSYPKVSKLLEEELEFTLTYLSYPIIIGARLEPPI